MLSLMLAFYPAAAALSSRSLSRKLLFREHRRRRWNEFANKVPQLKNVDNENNFVVMHSRYCIGGIVGRNIILGLNWGNVKNRGVDTATLHSRIMATQNYYHCHVTPSSSSRPEDRNGDNNAATQSSMPRLPTQFLQEYDSKKFDPLTFQRIDVNFDIVDGKPPQPRRTTSCTKNEAGAAVINADPSSENAWSYSDDWIASQMKKWRVNAEDFDDCSLLDVKSITKTTTLKTGAGVDATTISTKRILWSNWTEDLIRNPETSPILFRYEDLIVGKMQGEAATSVIEREERRLLQVLYKYGLVLIRGTPTHTESLSINDMSESTKINRQQRAIKNKDNAEVDDMSAESAILHLASIIGYHPLHTLYGAGIWSTSSYSSFYNDKRSDNNDESSSSALSTADSSYGSTSLPLHTDMTYVTNPPGVQVFLMVQPAEIASPISDNTEEDGNEKKIVLPKGQSIYLDGFAAARQLLYENPDAYRLLASTPRTYRCIDADLGWHLEAIGPVIETIHSNGLDGSGPVKAIRHNDLDRLPDLPPYSLSATECDSFYHSLREAHEAWDDILRRDSMRFIIDLQAGDCVLVANQRCLHGRFAFETSKSPRVIMGCYVGMDELQSKWRKAGFHVL